MKYIELFAGCGGLSLGLTSAGFQLQFANELSPMAAETYAYNLLGADLTQPNCTRNTSVKWISSNYSAEQNAYRLRENPFTYPKLGVGQSDLKGIESFNQTLLVGDIRQLIDYLTKNKKVLRHLSDKNIDLVSGGPPCQSFSMAGLRDHNNERNLLPMDFANFVHLIRPKVALLENVSGILKAFSVKNKKHYAWFEVAKAFASNNYFPICLHVNAKYAGAAQNRPRFILIALRSDIFAKLLYTETSSAVYLALSEAQRFVEGQFERKSLMPFTDLKYYDVDKDSDFFENSLFSPLIRYTESTAFTAFDAIDDLKEHAKTKKRNKYWRLLHKTFESQNQFKTKTQILSNHEKRLNSIKVRQRFLLYQHLSKLKNNSANTDKATLANSIVTFLQNPATRLLSKSAICFLKKQRWLSDDGTSYLSFTQDTDLINYLSKLQTKKQTQRALVAHKPAPAALSIPDDACHYDDALQRTLTVRELARFQSFPDWFEFRSKVTTGGQMRRYEVPQYTQVGNAVPPLLGNALGLVVATILKRAR